MNRQVSHRNKFDKVLLLRCVILAPLVIAGVLFEISFLDIFGQNPAFTFAYVTVIGFLLGEKVGGVFGLLAGYLLDALGGVGFSLLPIFYMLAGYLCGYMLNSFLRRNFLSYLVYACVAGLFKVIYTMLIIALHTESFNIIKIFTQTMVPEFFAFIICTPMIYFLCLGIIKITEKIKR